MVGRTIISDDPLDRFEIFFLQFCSALNFLQLCRSMFLIRKTLSLTFSRAVKKIQRFGGPKICAYPPPSLIFFQKNYDSLVGGQNADHFGAKILFLALLGAEI